MITVQQLFYEDIEFPDDIRLKTGVIYQCINLINGKSYVGQSAGSILDRWRGSGGLMTHIYSYSSNDQRVLYKALRKYGLNNFEVILLEYNYLSKQDRLAAEERYVRSLHTCIYDPECRGYNMTYGGEDVSQLFTPNAIKNRVESNITNHGGVMSFNQDYVIQAKIEKYGNVMGMCHTPEVRNSIESTCIERYGGITAHMNTPECREKSMRTNRANHGGQCAWNTPAAREKAQASLRELYPDTNGANPAFVNSGKDPEVQAKATEARRKLGNGDPMYGCHRPEVIARAARSTGNIFLINYMKKIVSKLLEDGLELTPSNYRSYIGKPDRHLARVYDAWDSLCTREEFTSELKGIYLSLLNLTPTTIENREGE